MWFHKKGEMERASVSGCPFLRALPVECIELTRRCPPFLHDLRGRCHSTPTSSHDVVTRVFSDDDVRGSFTKRERTKNDKEISIGRCMVLIGNVR